ncbi:MAG: hypothetical protein ACXVEU_12970 [Nocardioidaceae bacterium]
MGSPKTGTTYLQSVLWGSRDGLREQGFRLPLRSLEDHYFLTLALRGRLDAAVDPPQAFVVLDRLRRDVAIPGPEHLLVSHELLAPVEQERVDAFLDLFADFEVHVLVTARDLARQVPSEWQQHVKTRSNVTYQAFVERVVQRKARHFWSVQDVASVAQRWGGRLPPDRVHVVTVPPAGAPLDVLLTRFCSAVGLDPSGLRRDQAATNDSMGYEQTELLRRVNLALGDRLPNPRQGYNSTVKFWFAEAVLAQQPVKQRLALPPERWDWCRAVSREIVEQIEQAGYDVVGDLADLIPQQPRTVGALHTPSDADVAAVAVEAIVSMLDERNQSRRGAAIPSQRTVARLRESASRVARRWRG